jgi:hypothetical protein
MNSEANDTAMTGQTLLTAPTWVLMLTEQVVRESMGTATLRSYRQSVSRKPLAWTLVAR